MAEDRKERWRSHMRAQLAASTADAADRVKIQQTLASDGLKALLLANGGAMIALFTFIGNVLTKAPKAVLGATSLRWAFVCFVAGFTLGLIAHVLAFVSQDRYYRQTASEIERMAAGLLADEPIVDQAKERTLSRQGTLVYVAGLVFAASSVALFALGCGFALNGVLI